jgi:teichuronic acid biosynthesis glycosyltransferase TuaC
MAKLLCISNYPDEAFACPSSPYVYQLNEALRPYLQDIAVISPTPWYPRLLKGWLGRRNRWIPRRMAKRDYTHNGIEVHFPRYLPVPMHRSRSLWHRAIRSAVRRGLAQLGSSFDLVHAHASNMGPFAAQVARQANVPLVLTVHDEGHANLIQALRGDHPFRIGWQQADAIIRITQREILNLREITGPKPRFVYLPNGFRADYIPSITQAQARTQFDLPADRFVFVGVANWIPLKDPLILLDALARLVQANPSRPPFLCLVGEDLMHGAIQQRIAEHNLADHVRLVGQLPQRQVQTCIFASDAFVLYSHSEGLPCVMLETLGCGRPYIGSAVGGVPEVITDERLGLLGPPRDLDTLTAIMQRAMQIDWDHDHIRSVGQQYSWENIARRTWQEVYQPLLTGQPVGEPH